MSESREPVDEPATETVRDVETSLLRTENERLRRELRRSTRTTYRRTALALLLVGLATALAGLALPAVQNVLVVVGAIGVFGGILTWYLTPERVLSVSVIDGVFDAHARTVSSMRAELGLADEHVYVPTEEHAGTARLFVPLHANYEVPDSFDGLFLTSEPESERGIALAPIGASLYRALERSTNGELTPGRLPEVVPEAFVEQFELANGADGELVDGALTVRVDDPVIEGLDRPDHPIVSLLGVAAAHAVDEPVYVKQVDPTTGQVTVVW